MENSPADTNSFRWQTRFKDLIARDLCIDPKSREVTIKDGSRRGVRDLLACGDYLSAIQLSVGEAIISLMRNRGSPFYLDMKCGQFLSTLEQRKAEVFSQLGIGMNC